MFVKRFVSIFLVVIMCVPLLSIKASAKIEDDVTSPSVILMEPTTNKILVEKNANEQRACASITKVMTLLLIMEAIEDKKISYDDVVTTSEHAKSMGGSDIWLETGEQMTVHEMIKATAVASANDAAVALAEHLCGSESEFVELMNKRAKELNMKKTVFKNCNGLDQDGHLTTAHDVALMSCELMKHEKIFEYTNIWLDYLRDGETQIVNTNKLLRSYDGITGLKTGTTSGAGSCISASATRDGMSLVAVVLGSESGTQRFRDAAALLDYGFANYEVISFDSGVMKEKNIKVHNGMKEIAKIKCEGSGNIIVKKGSESEVEHSVNMKEKLDAPVNVGDKAGVLSYTLNGEKIAQFDIVSTEYVDKITFSSVMGVLWRALVAL
mgnify:CR=1 FL=1